MRTAIFMTYRELLEAATGPIGPILEKIGEWSIPGEICCFDDGFSFHAERRDPELFKVDAKFNTAMDAEVEVCADPDGWFWILLSTQPGYFIDSSDMKYKLHFQLTTDVQQGFKDLRFETQLRDAIAAADSISIDGEEMRSSPAPHDFADDTYAFAPTRDPYTDVIFFDPNQKIIFTNGGGEFEDKKGIAHEIVLCKDVRINPMDVMVSHRINATKQPEVVIIKS